MTQDSDPRWPSSRLVPPVRIGSARPAGLGSAPSRSRWSPSTRRAFSSSKTSSTHAAARRFDPRPRGVPHVWACVGNGPGRLLIAFSPAGLMEPFFREVTRANAMPPQDPALWRTHGMELLGLPLTVERRPPSLGRPLVWLLHPGKSQGLACARMAVSQITVRPSQPRSRTGCSDLQSIPLLVLDSVDREITGSSRSLSVGQGVDRCRP